jgi:hypothetical protein
MHGLIIPPRKIKPQETSDEQEQGNQGHRCETPHEKPGKQYASRKNISVNRSFTYALKHSILHERENTNYRSAYQHAV